MSKERIQKIRTSWPDKVPCIIQYGDRSVKFIMPCEFTIAQLMHHTRRRLKKIGAMRAHHEKAIFLFHATTLVFFSGFPAWQQRGDALYYASYFADKTFNPFVAYPILAGYFILLTLVIIALFGAINRRLNRHLPQARRSKLRYRPNLLR